MRGVILLWFIMLCAVLSLAGLYNTMTLQESGYVQDAKIWVLLTAAFLIAYCLAMGGTQDGKGWLRK